MTEYWPFVCSKTVRDRYFDYGKYGEAQLRKKLPRPLYWIRPARKVLWNVRLLQDFLLHGDRPDHQNLVEQYLKTLPRAK